jgi:hypothetical protein
MPYQKASDSRPRRFRSQLVKLGRGSRVTLGVRGLACQEARCLWTIGHSDFLVISGV